MRTKSRVEKLEQAANTGFSVGFLFMLDGDGNSFGRHPADEDVECVLLQVGEKRMTLHRKAGEDLRSLEERAKELARSELDATIVLDLGTEFL